MTEPSAVVSPLKDRRVLITRASHQAGGLVASLRELGAEPIECPTIAILPPERLEPLDEVLRRLGRYDWVIFTSANGVWAVMTRLEQLGLDRAPLGRLRIGAIGPATAAALQASGLSATFVPDAYVAEAILEQIGDVQDQRILLPRAALARAALGAGLRARGATVDEVTAYQTVPGEGAAIVGRLVLEGPLDALLFSSSSTVRFFLEGLVEAGIPTEAVFASPSRPGVICIGPITARTARDRGLPVDAVAEEYTIDGLVHALVRWFATYSAPAP